MNIYQLPYSTVVERVVPKNSFEKYANTKEKKGLTEFVSKIIWKHKISKDSVNLDGEEIQEIQIFEVQLKEKMAINKILDLIDKSIPYHIVFVITYGDEVMFRAAKKHPHPVNENTSVIDWVFESTWSVQKTNPFALQLKRSIDSIFSDFCALITNEKRTFKSIQKMIEYQSELKEINNEIEKLESKIKKCKQFNKKLELNVKLNRFKEKLQFISSNVH